MSHDRFDPIRAQRVRVSVSSFHAQVKPQFDQSDLFGFTSDIQSKQFLLPKSQSQFVAMVTDPSPPAITSLCDAGFLGFGLFGAKETAGPC